MSQSEVTQVLVSELVLVILQHRQVKSSAFIDLVPPEFKVLKRPHHLVVVQLVASTVNENHVICKSL